MAKCTTFPFKFIQNLNVNLRAIILGLSLCFISCDDDGNTGANPLVSAGSGMFNYTHISTNTIMKIFYFIPQNATSSTPIVFSFHGTNRNAEEYRNAMVARAENFNFIVVAPEFSQANFSGGDGYNLGNVFVDGDNPSLSSLNPENEWAFSTIAPIFQEVKGLANNTSSSFYVFGHSAGGQFAHRLLMFKPNLPITKMVVSAPGWYTFPDTTINFPYGLANSTLENNSLSNFFAAEVYVQVGDNDDDPNAAGLRHNQFADAQGLHRKERAIAYFNYCSQFAAEQNTLFNWELDIIPNTGHDFIEASFNAANLLFEN